MTFVSTLPMESLTFTPELVAESLGYFKDVGLDVKFESAQGSSPAIQSVITDTALLTRTSDIDSMQNIATADAPIVNVSSSQKSATLRLVSSTKAPIEKPEDLEGKKIGVPSAKGSSDTTVDLMAAAGGVSTKSVKKQVVGLSPANFQLVKKGRIAGLVVSADTAVAIQGAEPSAILLDPTSVVPASQSYVAAKPALADAGNKEKIKKYLKAVAKAMQFVIDDREKGFDKTLKLIGEARDVPILKTPELAKKSLELYVDTWVEDGEANLLKVDEKRWDSLYQKMVDVGVAKPGKDPGEWITNELVP